MILFPPMQGLGGGVFLRKIEADVHFRGDRLKGHVHKAHQVESAEAARKALQLIFLSRIVGVQAGPAPHRHFGSYLLNFPARHLFEFLQRTETIHHSVRPRRPGGSIPEGFLGHFPARFLGQLRDFTVLINVDRFLVGFIRILETAQGYKRLGQAKHRLLIFGIEKRRLSQMLFCFLCLAGFQ